MSVKKIVKEIAALQRMNIKTLRERYAELFGECTRSGNKRYLIKRIAWRLQSLEEGSLSDRARRKAIELANDADLRINPPSPSQVDQQTQLRITHSVVPKRDPRLPAVGTVITRSYKGGTVDVTVLDEGFEFEGVAHRSLSAVAKRITGSHTNGYSFFKLGGAA